MWTSKRPTGIDADRKYWASVLFQQTAKEMRKSFVPFYSKQHHTTSLLDATDFMRNLYQQRYWTWWTDEMTSVKETPPHLNCQDWIKPSRTVSVCTNGKKWRDFVETMDQKTDLTTLWRTIKGIDGREKREAENKPPSSTNSSILQSWADIPFQERPE